MIFYGHPWEYDPRHPVVEMEHKAKFTHYRNLDKMASRTDAILQQFQFTTVQEVLSGLNKADIPSMSTNDLVN